MAVDAIELFLQEQARDGEQDSQGSFTISGDRALKKLAEYQLPRASAWILKMIQAGVAAGADSIEVRQGAKSTELRYKNASMGTLQELQTGWTSPTPNVTQAQEHLLVGLRTVSFARNRPVLLTWRHPEETDQTLFWNGTRFSQIKDAEPSSLAGAFRRPAEAPELRVYVACSPLRDRNAPQMKGINDVVALEFRELQASAVTCPIPLRLDSRRVDHFGTKDVSMRRKVLAFGFSSYDGGTGPSLVLSDRFQAVYGEEPRAASAWTLYEGSSPEFSRVCWVKDGVICQEKHLDSYADRFSLRLYLPADDMDTDLTGLQLKLPAQEEWAARVGEAVRGACAELKLAPEQRQQFQQVHRHSSSTSWSTVVLCLAGGVAGVPLTGGVSFLLGLAGAATSIARGSDTSAASRRLEAWRSNLESRFSG